MDSPNSDNGEGNNEDPMNSPNYSNHNDEDELMDNEDVDYYDDDYLFADDNDGDDDQDHEADDDLMKLQAELDKIPPGVEASFSIPSPGTSKRKIDTSTIHPTDESWVSVKQQKEGKDSKTAKEILKRYEELKTFDMVKDFPDHHYLKEMTRPNKVWSKKVQDDWRMLEKDLPENIFARACESRMDLMRAAITGPQETPYHDGLFMFDIYFPPEYPTVPPLVNYHAHGMRLNPNLYDNGKVCLSLLNTWSGQGCEKWQPGKSTMLQVLVSIQALILNDKPYFNEPGYETHFKGAKGEQNCIEYSENILFMSLKTRMHTINNPPKEFEDLVAAHFGVFARDILATCTAHMDGARIGTVVRGEYPIEKKIKKLRTNIGFSVEMGKMMNEQLIPLLRKCGANCDDYIVNM